jgi:excisionase family DNA binding protein
LTTRVPACSSDATTPLPHDCPQSGSTQTSSKSGQHDPHVAQRRSPMNNPEVLSIAQVAARLGISRAHCYRLATRGLLPVLELGRRRVVPAAWLHKWLDDRYEDVRASETDPADEAGEDDPVQPACGTAPERGHRRVAT